MRASKSGGISRRTVTRGMAWTVPAVAVASAAPAFGVTSPPPVVAGQCGIACKHPGLNQNKTYHLTFCFTANQEVDGGIVHLDNLTAGADSVQAYSGGILDTTVSVVANDTVCYYIDGPGFTESSTDLVTLTFHYEVGGVPYDGCARGQVTGDVCGTSSSSPLKDQPKNWPHDDGTGDEGLIECVPNPGAGC